MMLLRYEQIRTCSDTDLFEEFTMSTRLLSVTPFHWKSKEAYGALWWMYELLKEMRRRSGKENGL
jgi:hypothetical protein